MNDIRPTKHSIERYRERFHYSPHETVVVDLLKSRVKKSQTIYQEQYVTYLRHEDCVFVVKGKILITVLHFSALKIRGYNN